MLFLEWANDDHDKPKKKRLKYASHATDQLNQLRLVHVTFPRYDVLHKNRITHTHQRLQAPETPP